MIWNEELAASLDQAAGTIVFHRVEPTRVQQLAQTLADRVAQMVEQNTKALDQKLGGGGGGGSSWNDRAAGDVGGESQERKGRSDRPRGGQRGSGGARGARGARFAQGLGGRVGGSTTIQA
jgi:translation initiation factor 3 subunit C